jgi:hypothetical protein
MDGQGLPILPQRHESGFQWSLLESDDGLPCRGKPSRDGVTLTATRARFSMDPVCTSTQHSTLSVPYFFIFFFSSLDLQPKQQLNWNHQGSSGLHSPFYGAKRATGDEEVSLLSAETDLVKTDAVFT